MDAWLRTTKAVGRIRQAVGHLFDKGERVLEIDCVCVDQALLHVEVHGAAADAGLLRQLSAPDKPNVDTVAKGWLSANGL